MWILFSAIIMAAPGSVYLCKDSTGHPTYTDRGCADNQPYTLGESMSFAFEPLSAAEQRQLKTIKSREAQAAQQRRRQTRQQREQQAVQRQLRKSACADARRILKTLSAQRRKGYTLNQQTKLDIANAKAQDKKRKNC